MKAGHPRAKNDILAQLQKCRSILLVKKRQASSEKLFYIETQVKFENESSVCYPTVMHLCDERNQGNRLAPSPILGGLQN
jgi:hypothetical protein